MMADGDGEESSPVERREEKKLTKVKSIVFSKPLVVEFEYWKSGWVIASAGHKRGDYYMFGGGRGEEAALNELASNIKRYATYDIKENPRGFSNKKKFLKKLEDLQDLL